MTILFFNKIASKYLNYKKRANFDAFVFKSTEEKMQIGHENTKI